MDLLEPKSGWSKAIALVLECPQNSVQFEILDASKISLTPKRSWP